MRLTFSMVLISMFAVSLMIVASPFSAVAKASAVVTSVSFPSASAAVGSSVMHKASAMRQLKTRFFMGFLLCFLPRPEPISRRQNGIP